MNLGKLDSILANQPKYRIKQVFQGVFGSLIDDWSAISNLPLDLRQDLAKQCSLDVNATLNLTESQDSQKVLITLSDGSKIESVLLRHADSRNTVCVSSQVGCPMGCRFCATGKMGFKRNLSKFEIIEQVLFFARELKAENQRVTNVVFMGMGEPLLNYDEVFGAIEILNSPDAFNIGARKISISTCGIIDGIKKITRQDLQINLAISLHAADDELRSSLMPVNKQYSLTELLAVVKAYLKKHSRKVMFEYLLIDGVNDRKIDAQRLAKIMKNKLFVVNLIPYNPTGEFQPSSHLAISNFKKVLISSGVNVTQRYTFGQDIGASCGQLATAGK
ncbi:MAG: 23S rRNA (adenine(2503)-C(2))-methyltransferase RlmN [Patescibacteria group bacterium]|jgi:23S rRNA (adenine2503-C2)-methyltransferase|nr:23S rRNA (adenine(2503)-C(2))-methyltransferase RlmN [Patescibacteria group bacterium]